MEKIFENIGYENVFSMIDFFAPLVLTIATIIMTVIQNYRNRKLQINIYNRDAVNQYRDAILNIYNSFLEGTVLASKCSEYVAETLFFDGVDSFKKSCNEVYIKMVSSYNQAKVLLDDPELFKSLENCLESFEQIRFWISDTNYHASYYKTIDVAWNIVREDKIEKNDTLSLIKNKAAKEKFFDFVKKSENVYFYNIQYNIDEYLKLMTYDTFDVYFRKYLQIKKL